MVKLVTTVAFVLVSFVASAQTQFEKGMGSALKLWKLEVGSWKLGDGSWKLEDGSWAMEVGSREDGTLKCVF